MKEFHEKTVLMDEQGISRAIIRIAHEIIEKNKGLENVALIGIQRRGVPMADRIAKILEEVEGKKPDVGILDITFYRDDLSTLAAHPVVNGTALHFNINDRKIVLVDDVLFTGRTVRAAIEAIFDMGRPACIQLATLVDRGHRQLPIRSDYVGKNVPTSTNEMVQVMFSEIDGCDKGVLCEEVKHGTEE